MVAQRPEDSSEVGDHVAIYTIINKPVAAVYAPYPSSFSAGRSMRVTRRYV